MTPPMQGAVRLPLIEIFNVLNEAGRGGVAESTRRVIFAHGCLAASNCHLTRQSLILAT